MDSEISPLITIQALFSFTNWNVKQSSYWSSRIFCHFLVVAEDFQMQWITISLIFMFNVLFYASDVNDFDNARSCFFVSYCNRWYFFYFVHFCLESGLTLIEEGWHMFWEVIFCQHVFLVGVFIGVICCHFLVLFDCVSQE